MLAEGHAMIALDEMIQEVRHHMIERNDDEGLTVEVVAVNHDAGSVVLFDGTAADGRPCLFAADHRSAQALADALDAGDGPVWATVQTWQMLG
jgi:hypothetical protein